MTVAPAGTKRVAIYCRISRDDEGLGLGVGRQRTDCEAFATGHGWAVAEVFVDNDTSAYSGKARPEYRRMLDAIVAGQADCIVAYHSDRLHRSPRELEDFIDLIERYGCDVFTTSGGSYDLSTSDGRFVARTLGNIARKESEDKSRRLRRKHAELAENGRPASGPGYGFNPDWTVNQDQAAALRDAARRILAGESVRRICSEWRKAGRTTARGREWVPSNLSRTLTVPSLAGLRAHHGRILGPGSWEPVLDRVTWDRLQVLLRDPARRTNERVRRYLLTGLVFCAGCGGPMRALPSGTKVRRYVCRPDDGGCYRTVNAYGLETLVADAVVLRLQSPAMTSAFARPVSTGQADLAGCIASDESALLDYADMHFSGELTMAEWLRLRGRVSARLQDNRKKLDASKSSVVDGEIFDARAGFWQMQFAERRQMCQEVIGQVAIAPGRRGYNRFEPARVQSIDWVC